MGSLGCVNSNLGGYRMNPTWLDDTAHPPSPPPERLPYLPSCSWMSRMTVVLGCI